MARFVELRRHTDNDGDVLTPDGVAAALRLGGGLAGGYRVAVSTGAQRATQTVGCLLAALGQPVPDGVVVEPGLRSQREDRWRAVAKEADGGDLGAMRAVDPGFVDEEAAALGAALGRVLEQLGETMPKALDLNPAELIYEGAMDNIVKSNFLRQLYR